MITNSINSGAEMLIVEALQSTNRYQLKILSAQNY